MMFTRVLDTEKRFESGYQSYEYYTNWAGDAANSLAQQNVVGRGEPRLPPAR